jgi:hypothetical protein
LVAGFSGVRGGVPRVWGAFYQKPEQKESAKSRASRCDVRRPTSDGWMFDDIDDADDIDKARTEDRRGKVPSEARKRPSPPGRARPGERGAPNFACVGTGET